MSEIPMEIPSKAALKKSKWNKEDLKRFGLKLGLNMDTKTLTRDAMIAEIYSFKKNQAGMKKNKRGMKKKLRLEDDGDRNENDASGEDNGSLKDDNKGSGVNNDGLATENEGTGSENDSSDTENEGSGSENDGLATKNKDSGSENDGSGIESKGLSAKNEDSVAKNESSGDENESSGEDDSSDETGHGLVTQLALKKLKKNRVGRPFKRPDLGRKLSMQEKIKEVRQHKNLRILCIICKKVHESNKYGLGGILKNCNTRNFGEDGNKRGIRPDVFRIWSESIRERAYQKRLKEIEQGKIINAPVKINKEERKVIRIMLE